MACAVPNGDDENDGGDANGDGEPMPSDESAGGCPVDETISSQVAGGCRPEKSLLGSVLPSRVAVFAAVELAANSVAAAMCEVDNVPSAASPTVDTERSARPAATASSRPLYSGVTAFIADGNCSMRLLLPPISPSSDPVDLTVASVRLTAAVSSPAPMDEIS